MSRRSAVVHPMPTPSQTPKPKTPKAKTPKVLVESSEGPVEPIYKPRSPPRSAHRNDPEFSKMLRDLLKEGGAPKRKAKKAAAKPKPKAKKSTKK